MLEIKVEVEAKGLCRAISEFTAILSGATLEIMKRFPVINQAAAGQQQTDTPVQAETKGSNIMHKLTETTSADAPETTQVPVATAAPSYTQDDIAKAGAYLADTDKRADLIELLKKFGARSIRDLKPEQYGAFAAELRKLGAKI